MFLVVTGIGQNESQALGCSSCSSKTAPSSTTSGSQLEILKSHIDQPELSAEGQ